MGTAGTISVARTISVASIFIREAKVHLLEHLLALVRRHDLLAPTSTARAPEPCRRRATPRWKRTDLLLPLGVTGQGSASTLRRGRAASRARAPVTGERAEFRRGQNYATNGYCSVR